MDNTRVNGTSEGRGARGEADPLDVALQAMRQYEHFANDLLVQDAIKAGDHLELYVMERRAMLAMAYAEAYQTAVTSRLLGHLVHAVNGLALALGEEEAGG